MRKIKIGIVGIGNCASSLVQGINYYKHKSAEDHIGILSWDIQGFKPNDIEVVAAFDIDYRKVGKPLAKAIFQKPNCTTVFQADIEDTGVIVSMGQVLDSISPLMGAYPSDRKFLLSNEEEASKAAIVKTLKDSGCEILINYLPVGSEAAARFYADCALEAELGFINCIPVFIANDESYEKQFRAKKLPIIGDDIKAQIGATITHRAITQLCEMRGVKINRTYQLNTGGNTDFLNMLDRSRLKNKSISKTKAVQSTLEEELDATDIHIGPSDYIPWLNDNKICHIRLEGSTFGGVPMELDVKLSVEDSPNSAGVVIDAIRFCKIALDKGEGGIQEIPSAYFMKHPPLQINDTEAYQQLLKISTQEEVIV